MVNRINNNRYEFDYIKRILEENPKRLKKIILKNGMSENIEGEIEVSQNNKYMTIKNVDNRYELIIKINQIIGIKIF